MIVYRKNDMAHSKGVKQEARTSFFPAVNMGVSGFLVEKECSYNIAVHRLPSILNRLYSPLIRSSAMSMPWVGNKSD